MTQEQLILFKRSLNIYNTEIEAWTALDNLIHTQGQPVVAFFRRTSNTHGDTALGAIFAIGTDNGVGKYKACSSHDDMLAVAQALNTHISEWTAFKDTFDKMFEYDANHKAIKAKLDFYTDSNKNISAGGLGGSGSSSLGALYQLVDVMINSTGDGVEGAVEGSVLAYDATAGKWKAIAQSEILPDMSGYYTKEETDAAINAIPIYSIAKLSASDIAGLSDGTNVREAYRLKKGGSNVDDTVIKIYKDSAIKSLELRDNKYLVLTYTDNEGNEQSISKDLSVIINDNYVDLINNQEIGGIKTFTEKTLFKKDINVLGDAVVGGEVAAIVSDGTPAGVTDYSALTGKPSINGKELASGNNTLDELGIQPKGDYTTASQLATTLENYATKVFVSNNYATKAAVNTIQALIPATASADNQLADKDFVNSSIATATAEFRGSFTSLDELKATSGNLNDYAFYLHTDSVGNSIVDRYKWTTAGWLYEYTLNNSSFTAEQWAALNSAITATLVNSYNSHLKNSTIHITSDERTKWNNKWDYNEETIKAVKVNAAVLSDSATKLATARKIWGQSFDGSGDVWGPIIIKASAGLYHSDSSGNHLAYIGHDSVNPYVHIYNLKSGSYIRINDDDGNVCIPSGNILIGTTTDNGYKLQVNGKGYYSDDLIVGGEVVAVAGEGTPAGVTDYSALTGKPAINGVTLVSGNNTLASLGIQPAGDYATNSGVTTLLADYVTKTFVSNNYVGKSAFNAHTADSDIHITAAERDAWNAKWDYNEATIKAVKVTSASSADSVAWAGISGKPTTFTPSAHTHTASDVSGLPTSLKNPYALSFGSKTYDGSAAATITASDLGALTSITKSMVEGVLTGDITSHQHEKITHTLWKYSNAISDTTSPADICAKFNVRHSGDNALFTGIVQNSTGERYQSLFWTGYGANGLVELSKSYGFDGRLKYRVSAGWSDDGANWAAAGYRELANIEDLTWTNIENKPTTIAGYGITDNVAYRETGNNFIHNSNEFTFASPAQKGSIYINYRTSSGTKDGAITDYCFYNGAGLYANLRAAKYIIDGGTSAQFLKADGSLDSNTYLNTNNYNSYAPTLTGTGASGTWGISITGNAATATNADKLDGYHSYAFRRDWGTSAGGSYIGWVRIMKWTTSKAGHFSPQPFLLSLYREYNSPSPEAYTLSFTFGWDTANIVQLNGNGGNRIIEKFRISKTTDQLTYYLEYYVNPNYSISTNVCYCIISSCYDFGSVELINEVASGDTSTLHEITTKLNSIVGNIEGSATKLATARKIWGQSFDGSGDVWGPIIIKASAGLYHSDSSGNYLAYIGHDSVNPYVHIYNLKSGSYIRINDDDGNVCIPSGNILIGTTTDNGYKLAVNGSERIYGDLIVDGEVSALVA